MPNPSTTAVSDGTVDYKIMSPKSREGQCLKQNAAHTYIDRLRSLITQKITFLFALMRELGPKGTKVVLVRRKARTSTALLKSKARAARLRMLRRPANLVRGIAMAAERQLLIELAFHAAEVTPSGAMRKSGSIQSDPTREGA